MKILEINSVCGIRSTGRIVSDLYEVFTKNGHECKVAFGRETPRNVPESDLYRIGSNLSVNYHAMMSRITDKSGFYSTSATKRFIKWIESYNPDIIHLHNIHGYYINIELLLNYLKSTQKRVVFTLHDCWSFTGHCAFFDYCNCDKWQNTCYDCEQKKEYPASKLKDNSTQNHMCKKELFSGLNMIVVTPSEWLRNLAKQSILGSYDVITINNGIDLAQFKPTKSDFREKYKLVGKTIILGVASVWERRKGLHDFIKLSRTLDSSYQIILVGLSEEQRKEIPIEILGISRTDSVRELAEIYTVADVFFNPTYEDNFPTTNIEALACGTPVITYNTGGSPEILDNSCGVVCEKGNIDDIRLRIKQLSAVTEISCTQRSRHYDKNRNYKKYLELIDERGIK